MLFGGPVRDEVNEAKTIHPPDVAIGAFLIAKIWLMSLRKCVCGRRDDAKLPYLVCGCSGDAES